MVQKNLIQRKHFLSILRIWFLSFFAISGWTALNIFITSTPQILDVIFGITICLYLFLEIRKAVTSLKGNLIAIVASWFILIWAIMIAILYPQYSFPNEFRYVVASPVLITEQFLFNVANGQRDLITIDNITV